MSEKPTMQILSLGHQLMTKWQYRAYPPPPYHYHTHYSSAHRPFPPPSPPMSTCDAACVHSVCSSRISRKKFTLASNHLRNDHETIFNHSFFYLTTPHLNTPKISPFPHTRTHTHTNTSSTPKCTIYCNITD